MITKENLQNIYSKVFNLKGFFILGISSILSYILLVLLYNFSLVSSYIFNFSVLSSLVPSLVLGYQGSVHTGPFILVVLTSLLIGLNISLLFQSLDFKGLAAAPGTLLGLTISGCAACTTGVVGIAGFSIGIGFFPYNGLEMGGLGVIMLGLSAMYISEKDNAKVCSAV